MRGAARGLPDSPRYQHQVQLAVTRALYVSTYGVEADACVVHVTEEGVHVYEQDSSVAACTNAILDSLIEVK
jgi:hypothetical protein